MPETGYKWTVRGLARPAGKALASIGVTANAVTLAGLVLAIACAWSLARGQWTVALVFLLLSSLCDLLDGAVARAGGGLGTPVGAALDSTADRYGEAFILGGILMDRARAGALEGWFVWIWLLALTGSFLTSYVRARAEGLGLRCEVGLLERPHRLGFLAALCLLGPGYAHYVLGALAVGGHVTFIQRLLLVWRSGRTGEQPKP